MELLRKSALLLLLVGATVGAPSCAFDDEISSDEYKLGPGTTKVDVCHIPPGDPDNAHTITIGSPAVAAHLDHGDFLGTCDGQPLPDAAVAVPPVEIPPPDPDAAPEVPDAGIVLF
jgi:hypothetical protein